MRELELQNCRLPGDDEQFACLSQLPQLSLIGCETGSVSDVTAIIQHLERVVKLDLQRLTLCKRDFVLDATSFSNIVDIVEERSNVLSLIMSM